LLLQGFSDEQNMVIDRQYRVKVQLFLEKQPTRKYHVLKTKTTPKKNKKGMVNLIRSKSIYQLCVNNRGTSPLCVGVCLDGFSPFPCIFIFSFLMELHAAACVIQEKIEGCLPAKKML
jgi:hypothetical protein